MFAGKAPNIIEPTRKTASLKGAKVKRYFTGYLFLVPFFGLFIMFYIIPVIWSFVVSFFSYDMVSTVKFIGLDNYVDLITNDELFITAMKNTMTFAVIAGPLGFLASFFFAWVINQLKLRNAFSLAFYAPSITSALAVSVVWLSLFSSSRVGFINNALISLGLISEPIGWTNDPTYIMPLIIGVSIWMSMGQGFLTALAGFSNMNEELFEAGRIDGVHNRFQELFLITLPQMKPQMLFNAVMSIVTSLSVFEMVQEIVGFPSPNNSAHTLVGHIYDYGFIRLELGYASAVAFILLAISLVLGQIVMKLFTEKD